MSVLLQYTNPLLKLHIFIVNKALDNGNKCTQLLFHKSNECDRHNTKRFSFNNSKFYCYYRIIRAICVFSNESYPNTWIIGIFCGIYRIDAGEFTEIIEKDGRDVRERFYSRDQ